MNIFYLTYWATALMSLSIFTWYIRSRHFTVIGPVFWYFIFHILVFVIRPFGNAYMGFDSVFYYMKMLPSPEEEAKSLIIALVGLLCFVCFSLWGGAGVKWRFSEIRPISTKIWSSYLIAVIVASPAILYSISTTMGGGVEGERIGATYVYVNTTGYIVDAQVMILPISIVFIALCRFAIWSYIPLMIYLGYVTIFVRARWQLVVGLLSIYFLYSLFKRRKFLILPVVLTLPIVFLVFSLKGLNRQVYMELLILRDAQTITNFTEAMSMRERFDTQDFANFEYLTYISSVVPRETNSYTYFTQWLQLFTEPIPRMLWTNKPVGAPIQYFDLNDYGNFIGLTPSLIGDGWMSLGWMGIIITMGLSGYILGRIHRYVCLHSDDPLMCIAYCLFTALLFQFFRDGGISIFKFALFAIMPVAFLWWLHRRVAGYIFQEQLGG